MDDLRHFFKAIHVQYVYKMKTLYIIIISFVLVFLTVSSNMTFADVTYNTGPPMVVKIFGPPLKQIRSGIAEDTVHCDLPSVLVMKSKDETPACVKPEHLGFLLARGWASQNHLPNNFSCSENCATDLLYDYGYICRGLAGQNSCFLENPRYLESSMEIANSNFTISYAIHGAKLSEIKDNKQSGALEIFLQTTSDGMLRIDLPRALIDARVGQYDTHFYVLADGQETDFKEIKTTDIKRTLTIPFNNGTSKIEIIGTHQI